MSEGNGNVRALERRDLLVKWSRRLGCLTLIAVLFAVALYGYNSWRKEHLARQANRFIARGDFRSAVLVARHLLEIDPDNLSGARAMAEIAEKARSSEAVKWRQKVAMTESTPTNELALARSALSFGQRPITEAILHRLPKETHDTVEYQELAAAVALVRKDVIAAESAFAAALQLAPGNLQIVFNLAALRLTATDPQIAGPARESLATLTQRTPVRMEALRALTADALARKDRTSAAKWSGQLRTESSATFGDALLYFQAVEGTDAAAPALAEAQAKAISAPQTAAEFITWMNRHGMARDAVTWSESFPKEIHDAQPVPLAIAESLSFLQDWNALRDFVAGKDWGGFEGLRLAVEAHALHRLTPGDRSSMEGETTWRSALKASQSQPDQLAAIAQLAEGWGYGNEAEQAWWQVANTTDNARTALSALQRLYKAKQDTRGLLRVAKRALELNPHDLVAANNCASLGLLVSSDSTARRLAAKLYADYPNNRTFAATYAYALHTEGKQIAALHVLEQLKDEELRTPAIAAYYVVILAENGQLERARSFLVDAKRAALLPEEQQLLDAAANKLLVNSSEVAAK